MARTRQKAKQRQAKRRAQEREAQVQGTTGQKPPSTPGEQAVARSAEAFEESDVIEESGGDSDVAEERLEENLTDEAVVPVDDAAQPVEAPEPLEAPAPAEAPLSRRERKRNERAERQAAERQAAGRDGRRRERARPRRPEPKREPRQRGRVLNFFVQVWAELRRVQWPDRNQVSQATGVVVVFCVLAGLYLAFFDWVFSQLVKAIL